jgi:hypothetical protein
MIDDVLRMDLLNIKLVRFVKEPGSSKKSDNGLGWIEWRALSLVDNDNAAPIAEWFYVAACNRYYYDNTIKNDNEQNGYFLQEVFDEAMLFRSALSEFNRLTFTDWDDFYDKMSKVFIYEE